jgi:hypothetical protein
MAMVWALCAELSHAQTTILNVDLNGARGSTVGTTYTGNGVLRANGSAHDDPSLGTPTGYWNGIVFSTLNSPSPSTGLLDSSGQATGISLSFANWAFQDNAPEVPYGNGNAANMALLNDYLGVASPSPGLLPTMTISGLANNSAYTLYVYGSNGGAGAGGTWSVNGSATQVTTGNGSYPFGSFAQGREYTVFSVLSDSLGRLVLSGAPTDDPYVILNGFQLSPVPEPGSLSLICAAGAVLLAARRRRG